ncbi:DUF1499 domain-containing protein [Oceanirhabdus sp. W0125-5]|uniref:DUF1499 domain-containing protein n=1 Tax=Oceanirhabdus sp. W0125-5 TaxID=2999116 RepID=UPI0022F2C504|nr:DUF1499 domain-containing protein [Oceanirhabdus sp. W0125-5]WBW99203.1 DUF1499 domain-containing protein [Oceanirhabdus sp. W0125-5]
MTFLFIIIGILIAILLFMYSKNTQQPNNLGIKNGRLTPLPNKPNCVSTQTTMGGKKIIPLPFKDNLVKSREEILCIIKSFPNTNIIEMKEDYIYVVFKTYRMKFYHDVEFYFDIKNKAIHYRSASRVGYSDLGLNRKRYNIIRNMYFKNI